MFHKDTVIIKKNNETNKFNTQTSLVFSHRRDRGPLFLTKEMHAKKIGTPIGNPDPILFKKTYGILNPKHAEKERPLNPGCLSFAFIFAQPISAFNFSTMKE